MLFPSSTASRASILRQSRLLWNTAISNPSHWMPLNGAMYIKLFQLAKPDLHKVLGEHFDVLLLDEAQDLNPAMLAVCLKQRCPKFLVGDPHQQIYAFNGAVNGLDLIPNYCGLRASYTLSQSFRFGPEIAFTATSVVQCLKRERNTFVMSSGRVSDELEFGVFDASDRIAFIGRTNTGVFEAMVAFVCKRSDGQRPNILCFVSDQFEALLDLSRIRKGQFDRVTSWLGRRLVGRAERRREGGGETLDLTLESVRGEALITRDMALASQCDIVARYKDDIEEYIAILVRQSLPQTVSLDDPRVQYVFSTVHKFKGLEFPTVKLLDDFYFGNLPQTPKPGAISAAAVEEINLLYVALTRQDLKKARRKKKTPTKPLSGTSKFA